MMSCRTVRASLASLPVLTLFAQRCSTNVRINSLSQRDKDMRFVQALESMPECVVIVVDVVFPISVHPYRKTTI
jgi:hypothetical protein